MVKRIEKFYIIICCMFVFITKFYRLTEIPYGIHVDEAGMGYDAWCLANYGIDRWLNHYPVYLTNFGGGQSALYAYLCAALIKLFGDGSVSILLMRLPGAIISLLAYFAALVMMWKAFGKCWMMVGAFLLGIMPYFIMQSRFGLDCNLLVNMITISVFLLHWALEKGKNVLYLLAGFSWGITYYTYALSYIPNTIVLVVLFCYILWTKREVWKKMLLFMVPVVIMGLPLALVILVNQFELPQINLPFLSIVRIPMYRGDEISFSLERTVENTKKILESILFRDWMEYNAFSGYYTMYLISIPFIMLGFVLLGVHCFKTAAKRKYDPAQIWWLIFVVYFLVSLGVMDPDINKMNGIFFAMFFFLMWGIRAAFYFVKKFHKNIATIALILLLGIYIKNGASFLNFYFKMYPDYIYPQFLFMGTYENILEHLEAEGLAERKIYVEANNIYYCLSTECNPYDYNTPEAGEDFYKNFVFSLPETYEAGAVYIVRETNYDFRGIIEQNLNQQFCDGMYVCYY